MRTFPVERPPVLTFFFLFYFGFKPDSFSSDVHIILFGFKVKPRQPAEYVVFLVSAVFAIHT